MSGSSERKFFTKPAPLSLPPFNESKKKAKFLKYIFVFSWAKNDKFIPGEMDTADWSDRNHRKEDLGTSHLRHA